MCAVPMKAIWKSLQSYFNRNINIVYSLVGYAVPSLLAIICLPLLYSTLGAENFGILTLMWAVTGYLSLFDLGLGRAMTLEVGQLGPCTEDNSVQLKKVFFKGFVLSISAGVLVAAIIAALLSLDLSALNQDPNFFLRKYFLTILILAASIPFITFSSAMRGCLEGVNNFRASSANRTLLGLLVIIGPFFFSLFDRIDPASLACSLLAARIISSIQLIPFVYRNVCPCMISLLDIFRTFRFGGWVTISSLVGPIMVYGDKFLVSYILGPSLLGTYSIVQDLLLKILIIPTAISSVLFPAMSAASLSELKTMYLRAKYKLIQLMSIICLIVTIVVPLFIDRFFHASMGVNIFMLTVILSVGVLFNSIGMLPLVGLYGSSKSKIVALVHLFELPIYLLAVYYMSVWYGLIGVSLAWTFRVLLDFFLLDASFRLSKPRMYI